VQQARRNPAGESRAHPGQHRQPGP
jgi:hypothetical protein